MKKLCLFVLLTITVSIRAIADEGMWLPFLLGKQVYNDMVKKGLKLTPEQLYSINKASLKDAIVIFGGGCTGEMVSAEGMLLTNHHCGYDVIANASTLQNNYLRDGFYAKTRNDEIPTTLSVQFLLRVEDVTKEVLDSLGNLSGMDRIRKQSAVISAINQRMSDEDKQLETRVSPLFKGNQFIAFVYQRYSDVRLVGAPPESVGKFGGDTDNWEWPRHTGDFSIFRVYTAPDGEPAAYAANNIPLKPKWFLPISLRPLKEGDFSMIWGYPGSTNRYESSYGIELATSINNPALVKLRDIRLQNMFAEMKKDPEVKLKLASTYAGVANYWKFYGGETKQLLKYDIAGQKRKLENQFIEWAKDKTEYRNLFADWEKLYKDWKPYALLRQYMNEGILGTQLMSFASTLLSLENALVKTSSTAADLRNAVKQAEQQRERFLKSFQRPSDQRSFAAILQMFYEDIPKDQHPTGYFGAIKNNYGALNDNATWQKLAAEIYDKSFLLDDDRWNDFIANPEGLALQNDPAFAFVSRFLVNYNSKYYPFYQRFYAGNNDLGRLFLKGIMEMDPEKAKMMYPDATFTMRVSYGAVKSYRPADAVKYDYVTTASGVLEKYQPGDYEFDLPKKQVELFRKKDFGIYADPVRKDLITGFITSNDITGGNSGSPVINGQGQLMGLAFDGNYEALSHKLAYDKELNRTICVDIRYVLWCIDKLGGAGHLIREMKIVR
jgi:hypothetical protein